jgi:hypothetical protein
MLECRRGAAMNPEWPDGYALPLQITDPLLNEWLQLQQCLRVAFGLAKGGGSSRGYLVLRKGRDQAVNVLAPHDPDAAELLRHWDLAVRCFERYAPSPI